MAIRFSEEDVRPMGLVAAGVNGIKLDDKDEVIGMEILPVEGEIFLLASDGKAKRVEQKEFPTQGRYGKGVRAWDLPGKVKLAAIVSGKPNEVATIHMSKGAAKSARLDAATIRKRAATRGDAAVELKPGEEAVAATVGWAVERFVKKIVAEAPKEEKPAKGKKPAKKVTSTKKTVKKATGAKKATPKTKRSMKKKK
jgi:DNA gyrase subunit A